MPTDCRCEMRLRVRGLWLFNAVVIPVAMLMGWLGFYGAMNRVVELGVLLVLWVEEDVDDGQE